MVRDLTSQVEWGHVQISNKLNFEVEKELKYQLLKFQYGVYFGY